MYAKALKWGAKSSRCEDACGFTAGYRVFYDFGGVCNCVWIFVIRDLTQAVLNNFKLDDFECIEEIVLILEDIGTGGGSRHDF